jgi:putative hydrolase of the HAD superfamily
MQQPTALFFDLDNTLLDDDASVLRSLALTLDVVRPSVGLIDDALAIETYLRISNATWNSGAVNAANVQELRLGFWRDALATAGCDDDALCTLARDSYLAFRDEKLLAYDDVVPALEALAGRYRLAVITNGMQKRQQAKLEECGLWHYFELMVASDNFERAKPHADMFLHALEALSVQPYSAWHIGDGIVTDVGGAHAAGIRGVWLNRRGVARADGEPEPHDEIASLAELAALLEQAR